MSRAFEPDLRGLGKVLAAIPEFILVLDRSGRILYINHVEEGYERDAVIGTLAQEIISSDSRKMLKHALAAVFELGGAQEYETQIHAPDGTEQWYHSRMYPIHDDNRVVAAMLMATNITELKAARDELQSTREASDQLRRLLPVCSWCDKIRNVEGNWETIASYLAREADADVSHSLCPTCFERETAAMGADDDSGPDDEDADGPTPA